MKLKITVYKESGKYYTDDTVENDKNIQLFDTQKFRKFIADNLPARIGEGFITVEDIDGNESFHGCLLRHEDVKPFFVKDENACTICGKSLAIVQWYDIVRFNGEIYYRDTAVQYDPLAESYDLDQLIYKVQEDFNLSNNVEIELWSMTNFNVDITKVDVTQVGAHCMHCNAIH